MFEEILNKSELPEGALIRYQRDLYAMEKITTGKNSNTFEEFKEKWVEDNDKYVSELNKNNPIIFNRKIYIDTNKRKIVTLFKRKGLDWHCYYNDTNPYGGGGNVSLEEALNLISDPVVADLVGKVQEQYTIITKINF